LAARDSDPDHHPALPVPRRLTRGGNTVTNPHIAAAALATLLVATSPVAYAETAAHSRTMAATGGETMIQPDQIRASKMIGSAVYDVQNRRIGHVKDLVLDRDGQVASVVVDVGAFLGIGGKYVAVNLRDLNVASVFANTQVFDLA
jgi:sporulation protein YlmC with PRC-barrel domain